MSQRYTSRVFDAGEAIHDLLTEAVFPEHPATGKQPKVEFGGADPDIGYEVIAIRSFKEEGGDAIEWRRFNPPGADEVLRYVIVARSWVPATMTSLDAWRRLKTLADAVQAVFFDYEANTVRPIGFDGEVQVTRVVDVDPRVWPAKENGWLGDCAVVVQLQAQI